MRKTKWPTEVPVLEAKDIHKGSFDGPNGTHCLAGWRDMTFGSPEGQPWNVAYDAISSECGDLETMEFNDNEKTPKARIARTWNRAMAKLGYVVGNPEAKS